MICVQAPARHSQLPPSEYQRSDDRFLGNGLPLLAALLVRRLAPNTPISVEFGLTERNSYRRCSAELQSYLIKERIQACKTRLPRIYLVLKRGRQRRALQTLQDGLLFADVCQKILPLRGGKQVDASQRKAPSTS